jgi:hypothetical protein
VTDYARYEVPAALAVSLRGELAEAISRGRNAVDPDALAARTRLFRSAVLAGAGQAAARSGALMKKHHALARRLRGRQDDYLRFTTGFRAPPDNNGTGCDIRMARLKQKVSGCLRTMTGARQSCAIRSYLPAAAKTAPASSTPWSCSPKASPGCPLKPDQTPTTSDT